MSGLTRLTRDFALRTPNSPCLTTGRAARPHDGWRNDLSDLEKCCRSCAFSRYLQGETRERCGSPDYNAPTYTHDMLMEDWGQGYCRFWTPKTQEGVHDEK